MSGKERKKRIKLRKQTRFAIQVVFFVLAPSAFTSAFASIKSIFESFSEGAALTWTPFAKTLLVLLIFTLIFGRFFCGYACAFGALGDWVYALSHHIQSKTGLHFPRISDSASPLLQCLKYLILVVIVLECFFGLQDVVNQHSPWTAFSLFLSGQLPNKTYATGVVLLVIIIFGMALHERAFCQYLCPMGALFALMPKLPTGCLSRNKTKCTNGCNLCEKTCPLSLRIGEETIREGECFRCDLCVSRCQHNNISVSCRLFKADSVLTPLLEGALLLTLLLLFV